MALVNQAKKEINAKIVYYGPPDSGKRSALQYIFSKIKPSLRGELKSVPAGPDNLLLFDFSPFDGPLPTGYRLRFHVYTLTGKVANPATWKMTLKGADGLVIMADASSEATPGVTESVARLREFLSVYGVGLFDLPVVLQCNSLDRDREAGDGSLFASSVNLAGIPCCVSSTASGKGVLEALTALSRLIVERVSRQDDRGDERLADAPAMCPDDAPGPSDDLSPDRPLEDAFAAGPVSAGNLPPVSLSCSGAAMEGDSLRIPLEISCGGTRQRMVITVSVTPEQQ